MGTTATSALHLLDNWLSSHGYSGYDPYDVKAHPWMIRLIRSGNRSRAMAIVREMVLEGLYTFPVTSRKILHIAPSTNAKAMGLFAASWLDLQHLHHEGKYGDKAQQCMEWLMRNKAPHIDGHGWGYPFDWQSKELVPAGTPNGIVTTAAGEAFWKHYRYAGDKASLKICEGICKFLCTLPMERLSSEQVCFSYTPLFINHVHNLNLFVAEFLIKTGLETGNDTWTGTGHKAVQYTLADQLPDGSFDYNGPPEKPAGHIDHYHTGFVLRMLHSIWELTGREDVKYALTKCYHHYVSHFFAEGCIPKLMPNRKYRIDIHSCAESIHCLSVLSPLFPHGLELARNVLDWTVSHLQDPSGYFYYGILKSRITGAAFKSKIPYIRWGQAWMHRALSSYLVSTVKNPS